ncbi:MAG: ABC transporter permease subunit [Nitrospiraceae bacterium]|nr:ABC transporter permease subunit [Nitrospiraceae bacterium]
MSFHRARVGERLILHTLLVLGCVVFSFPFVWMLTTSFKVTREMSADRIQLLPRLPQPQSETPYFSFTEYDPPEKLEDVPDAVWDAARRPLLDRVETRVRAWSPRTPGPDGSPPPAPVGGEDYVAEMVEGVTEIVFARISDTARSAAVDAEKAIRRDRKPGEAVPADLALSSQLSSEAVAHGVEALVAEVDRLLEESIMADVFNEAYRRFCLGSVRVRATDYREYPLGTGHEWRSLDEHARLVARYDGVGVAAEARIRFGEPGSAAEFEFSPAELPVAPDAIDRVFVRYRGDESWAKLTFEVIRDGQLFRAASPVYLYERDWFEQELRWPAGAADPFERRTYEVLEVAGRAPAGSPAFAVRVKVARNSGPGAWFAKLSRNYRQAFREVPYARYLMTSIALVMLNIVLAVFSCTLVAYAFARLEWPGRNACFGLLLATMMIPPQVTMIPGFLVIRYLGWFNTLLPLWVPAAFGAPFFIFLLRQFFSNVPKDLEDAARIDGCGFLRVYWHVMLPLVKPTIATIAIFTFMGVWNNFMGPLIYLNDERLFPLALGLFKFNLRSGGDVTLMMAGAFVMTLPMLALFFFVQRYFIQGISLTGTKG